MSETTPNGLTATALSPEGVAKMEPYSEYLASLSARVRALEALHKDVTSEGTFAARLEALEEWKDDHHDRACIEPNTPFLEELIFRRTAEIRKLRKKVEALEERVEGTSRTVLFLTKHITDIEDKRAKYFGKLRKKVKALEFQVDELLCPNCGKPWEYHMDGICTANTGVHEPVPEPPALSPIACSRCNTPTNGTDANCNYCGARFYENTATDTPAEATPDEDSAPPVCATCGHERYEHGYARGDRTDRCLAGTLGKPCGCTQFQSAEEVRDE